jgi:A/G-specific adenine glycosylase
MTISDALLTWYDANKRVFPWRRENPAAYAVLVSETMLQQTRAEGVRDYFVRFMDALPTLSALAAAPEDRLLKLWEGLGYYARARNLQRAARQILSDFQGEIPADYSALRTLCGVGDYTASAIASIVFGQPRPALDGNLLRVAARLFAIGGDPRTPSVREEIRVRLTDRMPPQRPGDFNQAFMDLGARICVPKNPRCALCPLAEACAAKSQGLTALLPLRNPPKPRRIEHRTVLLLRHAGRVALRKRPPGGLLGGLWEFPNDTAPWQDCAAALGLPPQTIESTVDLGAARHIFTHLEWHMRGVALTLPQRSSAQELVWVSPAQLRGDYALPSAFRAFLAFVTD